MKNKLIIIGLVSLLLTVSIQVVPAQGAETLSIWYPSTLLVNQKFLVQITDEFGNGVKDVEVVFVGDTQYTNQYGYAEMTAPATPSPEKTPYNIAFGGTNLPNSITVLASDDVSPDDLLQITAPSELNSGESFSALVTNNSNPTVAAVVKVEWFNPGDLFNEFVTDENGQVSLEAPTQYAQTQYAYIAYVEGKIPAISWINLRQLPQLRILSIPYEQEGYTFSVTVFAGENEPVDTVTVRFNDNTYQTNMEGKVQILAPQVSGSTDFVINATKEGYQSAEKTITIIDRSSPPPLTPFLTVSAPLFVNERENFTVSVLASNGQPPSVPVSVFFNGFSKVTDYEGKTIFTAPSVNFTTEFRIDALGRPYYQENHTMITINNTDVLPSFLLDVPGRVIEGTTFSSTITANGTPIENATVTFHQQYYQTDEYGITTFIAPLVDEDTNFYLNVSKTGYLPITTTIIIVNLPNHGGGITDGWIHGYVKKTSGTPIENASVTVLLAGKEITNTFTDEGGRYLIVLPSDTYTLKASKEGFSPSIEYNILVRSGTGSVVNFTLANEIKKEWELQPIDYVISSGIQTGRVLGTIDVTPEENQVSTEITTYAKNTDIRIQEATSNELMFIIDGPDGVQGTILSIRFGSGTLKDLNNITVIYDNESIPWVNFDTIFNMKTENITNMTACWTSVLAVDSQGQEILYILLWFPHFSQHSVSITLGEIGKVITQVISIFSYILLCGLIGIAFISPGILWFLHKRYFQKKKEQ